MSSPGCSAPVAQVVEAFGGDPGLLVRLAGGRGTSWRAGGVVLKPAASYERVNWLAAVLDQVRDTEDFRVARYVAAADGSRVVDGWSATNWVEGAHVAGRWEQAMGVSAALHAALAGVETTRFPTSDDPWSIGARVAWGEQPVAVALFPDVTDLLAELGRLLGEPWSGPPRQLIHGDLGGNIVYADGLPPGVIDMSPHVAPAPFADAIIAADAVAWEGAPVEFAARFANSRPAGARLLARAVVFRIITMVELTQDVGRVGVEIAAYRPVVEVAVADG